MRERPSVAIVGAGIAGLTAAHELVERDFEVNVYEHRFQCGGKAASTRDKVNGFEDVPGEHGFHFFPGWYRHLPDTLARIPSDRRGNHIGRPTVVDHLVNVSSNVLASYTRDPIPIVLHAPRSTDQAQKLLAFVIQLHKIGLSVNDALLFFSKLMEFLSVPDEVRRQKYDAIPWTKFIGLDARTPGFQLLTAHTRCLIAASPHEASAYTIATMAIRTLFESSITLDRVLDGPTSEVWIEPWVRYLEGRGVTFHMGYDLDQIDFTGEEPRIKSLRFSLVDDRYFAASEANAHVADYGAWRRARTKDDVAYQHSPGDAPASHLDKNKAWPEKFADFRTYWDARQWQFPFGYRKPLPPAFADYFLFAIPVEQMAYYINRSTMMTYYEPSLQNVVRLSSSLQWMAGIQFYFRTPINLEAGHMVLADSEWSLTAIDQTQFWRGRLVPDGVQSILSVDISAWNKKGRNNPKEAFRCTKDEIAEEVWAQLTASFNRTARQPVLQPNMLLNGTVKTSYHVDDNIAERFDPVKTAEYTRAEAVRFSADEVLAQEAQTEEAPFAFGERIEFNVEPLLVNRPRSLPLRPSPGSSRITNMFLAADYVDTATNLACMEGANEAARLAVNAVLDHAGSNYERCRTWRFADSDVLSTVAALTTLLQSGPGVQRAVQTAASAATTVGTIASRATQGLLQLWKKK
jgi:uncharacterized protein with NAD-binding domain and iron-sulfur cluster